MRTFHKGQPDEKKYGYIIIPIVVPSGVSAEEALDKSKTFDVVWEILNALRSHDDRFNAMVNKIALNKQKPNKQSYTPSVTIGRPGLGFQEGEEEARQMENAEIARQLELRFGELQDACMPSSWKSAATAYIGRIGLRKSDSSRISSSSAYPNSSSPAYTKRRSTNTSRGYSATLTRQ